MEKRNKLILLLSGGIDSTTCLYWAKVKGFKVEAIIFDYGQRHRIEIKHAVKIARINKCPYYVIRLKLPWNNSTLLSSDKNLPNRSLNKIKEEAIPNTYVPGRNTIFLSYALSFAESIKADGILFGANQIDYSGYPDCRIDYVKSFEEMANLGSSYGQSKARLKIYVPLIKSTKVEIVKLAKHLGVPFNCTWSCYAGKVRPCLVCDSCKIRINAFNEAGIKDN
ncbi:MAG: 7-cyano-7-deazaguanine synthase QueC [bacterium]